jgi:hypothetical protein
MGSQAIIMIFLDCSGNPRLLQRREAERMHAYKNACVETATCMQLITATESSIHILLAYLIYLSSQD